MKRTNIPMKSISWIYITYKPSQFQAVREHANLIDFMIDLIFKTLVDFMILWYRDLVDFLMQISYKN